jgi:hypothetical protein
MTKITTIGYLPGYSGDPRYEFSREFDRKISVSFDNIHNNPDADLNVLVQCEPPELYQKFAGLVKDNCQKFDLILTYDTRLLELPNAVEFCPVGSWISDELTLNKIDQISYMMSSKIFTNAHRMRFMILKKFGSLKQIGKFDFIMHRSPPRVASKDPYFSQAKFNIACENQILPNMFTEKLLDCFKTRTVPIYFGCTNLDKYFDTRGVIKFYTIEELEHILNTLNPSDYERMKPYIDENYNLAKPFWEQSIYQRIENLIAQHIGL